MQYIVFFQCDKQVIASSPEDFLSDAIPSSPELAPESEWLEAIKQSGGVIRGTCLYDGELYADAVLLQVFNKYIC